MINSLEFKVYSFLFMFSAILYVLTLKQIPNVSKESLIPNMFSLFIMGPIFFIVGALVTKSKFLYNILFFVSIGLFISIVYGLYKEKRALTFLRCVYLFLFIPLLLYISIKQERSNILARRALLFISIVYLVYNINKVSIHSKDRTFNRIFEGAPEHPVSRLMKLLP